MASFLTDSSEAFVACITELFSEYSLLCILGNVTSENQPTLINSRLLF